MKIGKKTYIHAKIYKLWIKAKSGGLKRIDIDLFLLPTIEVAYGCNNFGSLIKSLEIHFRFLLLNLCVYFDKYE